MEKDFHDIYHEVNERTGETKMRKNSTKGLIALFMATVTACSLLCGCGSANGNGLTEKYAKEVSELTIPDNVKIIGFGEATHGNDDFQELKTEIFKNLVEQNKVRAFALEGPFGDYLIVDDYINGGETTIDEAVEALCFRIYKTETSKELLEWMKDYNAKASDADKLHFYGFDMQNYEALIAYIDDFASTYAFAGAPETKDLARIFEDDSLSFDERKKMAADYKEAAEDARSGYLSAGADEIEAEIFVHAAVVLEQAINLSEVYSSNNGIASFTTRDKFMAENVEWISELEKMRGGNARNAIFITGHCGHIAKVPQSSFYPSNMGGDIKEVFDDDYFVIGSDYYTTDCNMPGKNGRANHKFKSTDPLAKEANNYDGKRYLLQFSDIDGSDVLNDELAHLKMGSLGENYSMIMRLSSASSRIKVDAQKAFDAVVFVYSAKPIKLLEK